MNEFEIAVVNEPSVLEPLKFYCSKYVTSSRPALALIVYMHIPEGP